MRCRRQCQAHVSGVKSGSSARASESAARRIPYARSTWAACPAKRRAYSTTLNVRACRLLPCCAAPPARILYDHASGEESMNDIVRALKNGTVRDLHVRELDLSGTKPFREGLLRLAHSSRPPARSISHHTQVVQPNQCGNRWLSAGRRSACEAGNACVGWSA